MARPMKDSGIEWIGEIPHDWDVRKIKHSFSVYAGATPKSEKLEFWDGNIPWVTPADFKTTDKYVAFGRKNLTKLGYDSCGATLVPAGSIIFSKRAPVGTVVISSNSLCTNQGCLSCVPYPNIQNTYFYYTMSVFTEQFELVSSGTTFKEIGTSVFENFQLPFPPLTEQQRIANYLDTQCTEIDRVLEKTRASIEDYKKLKQAVITQAVTKGVRGARPMKDSGIEWIGEIPACVEMSRVGLHYDIILGKMICSVPNSDKMCEYPYFCAANVHFSGVDTSNLKKMWFSADEIKQYAVKTGDLLVVEGGAGAGGCAIVNQLNETIGVQNSIQIVRPKVSSSNVQYLCYLIQFLVKENYIDVVCNKATIPHFTKDKLANMPYIVWSAEEQAEIAEYLDAKCTAIDTLIDKKQQFLTELESYKKSLIYECVTGKREV